MYFCLNARALGHEAYLSAEATIELAAHHGFGGVDFLVRDLVEQGVDVKSLGNRLADSGLRPGAWPLPIAWRDSPEADFARDLERLARYAEVAASLGLRRTGTWVMPETPPGQTREATLALHVERLSAIGRVLGRFGIDLGLEVIGVATSRTGRGEPFIHRLADLDPVVDQVGRQVPNVGVLLDGFHLHAAGEPIEHGLAWGVDRVVWVHVADLPPGAPVDRARIVDAERGLPGAHEAVGTAQLLDRLARSGYDGPVTPEPMAGCLSLRGMSADKAVELVAEAMRSIWPAGRP